MKELRILSLLLICFLGAEGQVQAQNPDKVAHKLEKLYQKGDLDKLQKKAQKYRQKDSRLEVVYYYLARTEMAYYRQYSPQPHKKQFTHLRKASSYARKLKEDYAFYQDSIAACYLAYADAWGVDEPAFVAKVEAAYKKNYQPGIEKDKIKITAEAKDPEASLSNAKREKLLEVAESLVGTPYVYAGETPKGFDCSGFVKYVYQQVGIELPHSAQMQSQLPGDTLSLLDALPGDMIFFGKMNKKGWRTQHAAIVYDNDPENPKIIHAPGRGVTIDGNNSSWESYWKPLTLFVVRLPELEE